MSSLPNLQKTPTVHPAPNFNAGADAEVLRKAMKGAGTDEEAIIDILTQRCNYQRLDIAAEFKNKYDKDLIDELKSELSGDFEDVILALMTPVNDYYAQQLHKALSSSNEDVLIEVLCTLDNLEIRTIRVAYKTRYGNNLEVDIGDDTSGDFKRLLISLCAARRDETGITNQAQAKLDAEKLVQAGVKQKGTDDAVFNEILCTRNFKQLRLTFDEYKRIAGHEIEDAIKKEFSDDAEDGFLALVSVIRNLPLYLAKCLHKSMDGLGTNDEQLIRIIVVRSEKDMKEIKTEYASYYKNSLKSDIIGDTSGDYKKCLLKLIGES